MSFIKAHSAFQNYFAWRVKSGKITDTQREIYSNLDKEAVSMLNRLSNKYHIDYDSPEHRRHMASYIIPVATIEMDLESIPVWLSEMFTKVKCYADYSMLIYLNHKFTTLCAIDRIIVSDICFYNSLKISYSERLLWQYWGNYPENIQDDIINYGLTNNVNRLIDTRNKKIIEVEIINLCTKQLTQI